MSGGGHESECRLEWALISSDDICQAAGRDFFNFNTEIANLESWIKILKNDKNAIFTAAKHASAAFDYLAA